MRALPDVTSDVTADTPSTLQWVGMEDIAVPVTMKLQNERPQTIAAKSNVYVSLEKPDVKGIHMSRLHGLLHKLADHECNKLMIEQLLDESIAAQENIGQEAKLDLTFDVLLEKPALLSGETGFQSYPVTIRSEKNAKGLSCKLELKIPYSSTCPCSASLARQLLADAVNTEFADDSIDKEALLDWIQSPAGSVATPHSQRSFAHFHLWLGDNEWPDLAKLIFHLEDIIATPVQTAVKRVDEQEFARLNAENLMFCEDSARKLKKALEQIDGINAYWLKVDHQESLHAHNAVAIDQGAFGK